MPATPVPLAAKCYGAAEAPGTPWVILHGLMGRGRNWHQLATALQAATASPVWLLDLRNHGDSPHAEPMDYPALAADVRAWLEDTIAGPIQLVGHSMGGKAAMRLAVDNPEKFARLVVIDITAGPVAPRWQKEFAAMASLNLATLPSRQTADDALTEAVPNVPLRQFLLSNLDRDRANGGWRWKVNLPVLIASMDALFAAPLEASEVFSGKTLWIRGGRSNFFDPAEWPLVQRHFPAAELVEVPDAGHNIHTDNRDGLLQALLA